MPTKDPLDRYRSMRDFARTPEPAGGVQGAGASGRFVVQRHRARRLHYDFRLEIDGVLMSWAVPRGPSLDPGAKRLAMHTEDHPIEYFDFEGVIPKGEYGGGDVIVWDWGTFRPEETTDPGAAVRAGELKMVLTGRRLNGRFTIVRTAGRGPESGRGESWLLLHKKDAFATAGWDAQDFPESVKTGRTNDEVKAGVPARFEAQPPVLDGPAIGALPGAARAALPAFVPFMSPTLVDVAFSDPDWLFEVKWDGFRVQARVHADGVEFCTRRRQDAARYFPVLAGPADWIDAREAIVDGEVVALGPSGAPDFGLLQEWIGKRPGTGGRSAACPVVYQAFDLLHLDGWSLLGVPLEERKRLLQTRLADNPRFRYTSHVEGDGEAFFAAAEQAGLEGIVARHRRSRYESGRRSKAWLKMKILTEQELVVGGWEIGTNGDLGSLLLGVHEDGRLVCVGEVGTGFTERVRLDLLERLRPLARDASPFDPAPRLKAVCWVEPRLAVRVAFREWTSEGMLRQPTYRGIALEVDPQRVTRERPIATTAARRAVRGTTPARAATAPRAAEPTGPPQAASADEMDALERLGANGVWSIGGHELKLTNLDKVLFPADAVTKRDLIRYYVQVAPTLLPHLANRSLNMDRRPNGITGGHFWHKEVPPHAPAFLRRWQFRDGKEEKTYLVADQVATLAWLGNQAAIDIHPWTSHVDAPLLPTWALIDIDPGEKNTFADVVHISKLYRAALEHLDVRGYPKLSGKRGVQVYVPIRRIYTFEETRAWVERLSRAVGQMVPELISWEWDTGRRGGLARLDFTQNALNKTLVAPYAVRPVPGAPVSAPIRWADLDDPELSPARFTIRTMPERLAEVGDLFEGAEAADQALPAL